MRLTRFSLILAASALVFAAPLAAQVQTPEQIAAAALKAAPVWDGHNDVPEQIRERYKDVLSGFDFADTSKAPATRYSKEGMHTDLPRLRQGKVGAQFWSVYVDADLPQEQAVLATIEQIDVTKRLIAKYPDDLAHATSSAQVEAALRQGKIASLLGMEGGSSINGSLAVLRQMYDLGARYLTLSHSKTLDWVDSATDAPKSDGLSDFGKDVVREMNRIGMLVDLSHVSEASMMDALDVAQAPVIFSHSGARGIAGHARNVPDSVLARLKDNGGIVMVVALPDFLDEDLRQWNAMAAAEEARLKSLIRGDPEQVKTELDAWKQLNPAPKVPLSVMADHIDHIRQIAGIDHIGLGGDYDGMETGPVGMEDVTGYPRLFEELARRGYTQADLEKIASRNMMRVLKAAEAYAAAHKADAPIERPVTIGF